MDNYILVLDVYHTARGPDYIQSVIDRASERSIVFVSPLTKRCRMSSSVNGLELFNRDLGINLCRVLTSVTQNCCMQESRNK